MPKLILEMEKCVQGELRCPFCTDKLTKGFGYAVDYMCSLMNNRETSGYVEWDSEINPIPDWCPIRADKDTLEKDRQEKIMGIDI